MARMLVTGAAGFIGSHLCRRLVADGHEVRGLDDLSAGSEENLRDVPEVDLHVADLRELDAIRRSSHGVDVILHEAAKRSVPYSVEHPVEVTEVNVNGTLNVLLVAREHGARVVAASSSSIYGDQTELPLVETMVPKPKSPYAASKLSVEALVRAFADSMGTPGIALRYFNAYGPGQDPESEYAAVIPRFIVACRDGGTPVIHGDGEQSRDFTYIDDVVEANLLAARAGDDAQGRAFNVAGGRPPTSVNELLSKVAALVGASPTPAHEPSRRGDIRVSEADVSLAGELLGYRPAVDIDEGLRRTAASFMA
jgi:nucleoside-diphosphate-sugar epimerase